MKKSFLKLLILTGVCLATTLNSSAIINNHVSAQEIEMVSKNQDSLNIKFLIHEGDIIIGKVIFNDKQEFTKATISDNSLKIDIVDGQVEIYELKPETEYKNLSITLTDSLGKEQTFKINNFKTPSKDFIGYSNVTVNLHEGNSIARVDLPKNPSKVIEGIKSAEISDKSITIDVADGVINLYNLKDGKTYSDLTINIIDNKDNKFTTNLNTFQVPNKEAKALDVKVSSYKNNYSGEIVIPDGITPIQAEISDKSLIVDTVDGDVTILELKPQTTYSNLLLTLTDNKNKKHIFKLNTFSTLNKNFGYADSQIVKEGDNINVKILLPEDLKISNAKISDSNIKFKIADNQLFLLNLKANTVYNNLKIIIQDTENKLHNFIVNEFSTSATNVNSEKLSAYIENAYVKAFDRTELDKDGFEFWMDQLSKHKIGGRDFILNILNTDEFIKVTKDSRDKITKIYAVMFNRTPDNDGLSYWISEYDKDFKKTKDEKVSISNVVKEMTKSKEFQKIVSDLGIAY